LRSVCNWASLILLFSHQCGTKRSGICGHPPRPKFRPNPHSYKPPRIDSQFLCFIVPTIPVRTKSSGSSKGVYSTQERPQTAYRRGIGHPCQPRRSEKWKRACGKAPKVALNVRANSDQLQLYSLVTGRNKKIKCVFRVDDNESCVTCKAKGKSCVEQKKVLVQKAAKPSSQTPLEERVAQLEALLRSQAGVAVSSPQTLASNRTSPGSPENFETSQRDPWQDASGLQSLVEAVNSQGHTSARTDIPRIIDPVGSIFNNAIVGFVL
jgi:hypothetical protein